MLSHSEILEENCEERGDVPLLPVTIGNLKTQPLYVKCLVDSGANISLIRRDLLTKLMMRLRLKTSAVSAEFQTSDSSMVSIDEQVRLHIKISSDQGTSFLIGVTFFVVDKLPFQALLGTNVLSLPVIEGISMTKLTLKDGDDTFTASLHKPQMELRLAHSVMIPPYSFGNAISFIDHKFNDFDVYSFLPENNAFQSYFSPRYGYNVFSVYNDTPYTRKFNKDEYLGEMHSLTDYDPDSSQINLNYHVEQNGDKELVTFIHFKDRIGRSQVLNEEEKATLISDMDKNHISQLPMTDYINEYDKSQCELKIPKDEWDKDPISKVNLDHLSPEMQTEIHQILEKNINCFARHPLHVGKVPENILSAFIPLKDPTQQYRIQKYFPLPPAIKPELQKIIDHYLALGILEFSQEPARMISNLLAVKKKDGSLRLLCDLRLLNSISQKLTAPYLQMPHIADMLQGNIYRSSFDLSNSFFQISVDPSSRPLLCFRDCNNRILRYTRLPQGLTTSPFYLSQLANLIANDVKNTMSFVDDFLFCHNNIKDHNMILDKLLQRLCELNLTIRPDKLQILREEIDFLGYTFKPSKVCIPKLKIKTFLDLKPPKTAKQCKSMICAFNFFRSFIPDFTYATHHMRESFKNPRSYQWTEECEKEFYGFKKILEAKIELQYVDFKKDFTCYADASKYSVAFSIFQVDVDDPSKEAPITFCARTLHKYESTKSANELETLSIVWGLVSCDVYLRFATTKITVKTDCRALVFLKEVKEVSDHMFRLSEKLNQYQIHIQHISGLTNSLADFYSRLNMPYHRKREESKIRHLSKEDSDYMIEKLTFEEGHIFTPEEIRRIFSMAPTKLFTSGKKPPQGKKDRNISTTPLNSMPSKKLRIPKSYKMKPAMNKVFLIDSQRDNSDFLLNFPFTKSWTSIDHQNDILLNMKKEGGRERPVLRYIEEKDFDSILSRVLQVFKPSLPFSVMSIQENSKQNSQHLSQKELSQKQKEIEEEMNVEIYNPSFTKTEFSSISSLRRNGTITKADLIYTQASDPHCMQLAAKMKNKEKSVRPYSVDLLGIIGRNTVLQSKKTWKPILPKILLSTLVMFLHYGQFGLHSSPYKIVDLIRRNFIYPNLAKEVKLLLSDCYHCFYNKAFSKQKTSLVKNLEATGPMQIVAVDYAGEFTKDNEQNTKLIIFVDEYSGFVVAYPCAAKDDDTSEKCLLQFIQHFGPCNFIRSDNELSLKSKRLQVIYNKYQIEHLECSPYNPNSNSRVESTVKKLKEAIRANLHTFPGAEWSSLVMDICIAINSMPLSCGATPAELLFSKNFINLYEGTEISPSDPNSDVLSEKIRKFREFHTVKRTNQNEKQRNMVNEKRIDKKFEPGDLVYVEVNSMGKNEALRLRREGPYYIKAIRHQHSAQLQNAILPEKTERIVHFKDLIYAPKETRKDPSKDEAVETEILVESPISNRLDHRLSPFHRNQNDGPTTKAQDKDTPTTGSTAQRRSQRLQQKRDQRH